MKKLTLTALAAFLAASSVHAALTSLEIAGVYSQVIGSTAVVNPTGVPNNLSAGALSGGTTAARYIMNDPDTNTHVADMRVTYISTNLSGGATLDTSGGRSGLMIARTANSQGLTDTGTLSILMRFNSLPSSASASMTFRFEFFTPDGLFTTALPLEVRFSAFDLDFDQFMSVQTSDFTSSTVGTNVSASPSGSNTTYFDNVNPYSVATFNDPLNSVFLESASTSSFDITVGTTLPTATYSLFMFELRTDSEVIPEPAGAILLGMGMLTTLRRRRIA